MLDSIDSTPGNSSFADKPSLAFFFFYKLNDDTKNNNNQFRVPIEKRGLGR